MKWIKELWDKLILKAWFLFEGMRTVEIVWSLDREYYYVPKYALKKIAWLSVKHPIEDKPEKFKWMAYGVHIVKKDGTEYWREVLPFRFWKVRTRRPDPERTWLPSLSDEVMDYRALQA